MKDTPGNRARMLAQAVEHSLEASYPTGGLLRNNAIDEAQACLDLLAEIAKEPEKAIEVLNARMLEIDWKELERSYKKTLTTAMD